MNQVLHLIRLTIETETPLSIGSGDLIAESDVALVRDANGLPIVPGSTLQGRLRHMWRDMYGKYPDDLLGYAGAGDNGQAGRVVFGFGLPHDSNNKAVSVPIMPADIKNDLVLAHLAEPAPVLRHHVKLDHRSVAEDKHKFDRSAAPRGARFSFELAMWGKADDDEQHDDKAEFAKLASLIKHAALRLGGAGRRGYGKVKLISHSYAYLTAPMAIRATRKQAPSAPLNDLVLDQVQAAAVTATVTLNPIGPWRISWHKQKDEGASYVLTCGTKRWIKYRPGMESLQQEADALDGDPRMLQEAETHPVRESRIVWNENGGSVERPLANGPFRFPVPGSAIRGPLAHRALFHWNAAKGRVIDVDEWLKKPESERKANLNKLGERPDAFHTLFGTAKERKHDAKNDKGQASALFVADGMVEDVKAVQAFPHSSIDRFTGGVRSGALYTEEVAIGGTITLELLITKPKEISSEVRTAFLKALRDLTNGRLAFGARSHGFANGEVTWTDASNEWASEWRRLQ